MTDEASHRPYRFPWLYVLTFLVLATTISQAAFTHWHRSFHEKRNPHWRRNVLHHVLETPQKRPEEFVVLIVSHSQGFGMEMTDAETYAVHLEKILQAKMNRPVRVVNWSLPAAMGPEYILLTAAAQRVRPDVLLCVLSPRNFLGAYYQNDDGPVQLSAFISDARDLLALRGVRNRLPRAFIDHYVGWPDILDATLSYAWPIWRYKDFPAYLAGRWPALHAFLPPEVSWAWGEGPRAAIDRDVVGQIGNTLFSAELSGFQLETMSRVESRRILVSNPRKWGSINARLVFDESFITRCRAFGIEYHDFSRMVPAEMFTTGTHLTPDGHREMAEQLLELFSP